MTQEPKSSREALQQLIQEWKTVNACPHYGEDGGLCLDCRDKVLALLADVLGSPRPEKDEAAAIKELVLIREAALDASLSDGAFRAVAMGLEPPTADDIASRVWRASRPRR